MSDEKNHLIPLKQIEESGIDLNEAKEQAEKMTNILRGFHIKEATFDTGAHFKHDEKTSQTTIAGDGLLINTGPHTTTIIMRNKGSTPEEALEEVKSIQFTQKSLGSFSGKSQPWISNQLSDENEED
jgi:hypothetical protein